MDVGKFSKDYLVRSYECDKHKNLRLLTLMNILQDMADTHAERLGVGYDFCAARNLAWVAASYHIKINRAPTLHEQISITTWPSEEKKLAAIRDYEIRDSRQNLLIQASTQWVLIDFITKRPTALRAHLPAYQVVPEKADSFEFTRLPLPENFDIFKTFTVRFDEIDINNHVNNAVYPLWVSETATTEFRDTHQVSELEIAFKKEALAGETIQSAAVFNGLESFHTLTAATDGRELARAAITWSKV